MRNVFFSVIIPTYNEENYLPRLLDDLAEQKEKSFEVIVVDGKSRDKTRDVAQSFADRLPLRIEISPKSNVSYQRNLGASLSQGSYLIFFDADIQIPKRFLQLVKQEITIEPADYLTTYGRADSHIMYDVILARGFNLLIEMSRLIDKPCVLGFNFFVKKSVFASAHGFREDVLHGEDFELAERLFRTGYSLRILRHPRMIYSFRRYRQEGRINVMRKNAQAAIYFLTKGPITKEIFDYPMGGAWYKQVPKKINKKHVFQKLEQYVNTLIKSLFE